MDLNKESFRKILLLITLSAIIVWGVFHASTVFGLIRGVFKVLSPFILGLCIAFAINLLLRPIESGWDHLSLKLKSGKWTSTTSIISWGVNFFIALVFCLYVLAQKEQLGRQTRKVLLAFLPEKTTDEVIEIASLANRTFAKFVTGQLTDALIVGILCLVGMIVLSIPYAPTISVLVGATSVIPVFGALIGTAVGALFILMVDPIKTIWFVIFIIILQQFESNVIYPRVVGKSVGLPGIWVLAAITIGGSLFGLLGMLVSVPVGSILYILLKKTVDSRLERRRVTR